VGLFSQFLYTYAITTKVVEALDKNNNYVSKTHIRQMREGALQLKLCATSPPPFQGQHLDRWLYASI